MSCVSAMSANIKEEDYDTVDKLVDEAVCASMKSRTQIVKSPPFLDPSGGGFTLGESPNGSWWSIPPRPTGYPS